MQIAVIVGHELLNVRGRHLRDQIADSLIVRAGAQISGRPRLHVLAVGVNPGKAPLFGDFTKGFPPTFLQTGTRDLFLSNTVRMHRALRAAGVPAELHVFEAMPHGGFGVTSEDAELDAEVRRFVDAHWQQQDAERGCG